MRIFDTEEFSSYVDSVCSKQEFVEFDVLVMSRIQLRKNQKHDEMD